MQFITLNIIVSYHLSLSSDSTCMGIDVSLGINSGIFTI